MTTYPIKDIKVKDRARKDYGEIGKLSNSIQRLGLINPITIHKDGSLVAGERRLKAVQLLKWNDVPVRVYEDLTPMQKKEIELEENLKRKDMSWQEEVKLKEDIHLLKKEEAGGKWSQEQTADFMGVSKQEIERDTFLSAMLESNPELKNEKDKSNAFRKAKRMQEAGVRQLLVTALEGEEPVIKTKKGKEKVKSKTVKGVTLKHQDCLLGMADLCDGSVDLILTDPVYGVDVGESDIKKGWDETFEDGERETYDLLEKVIPETYRIAKEGAHGFFFFPMTLLDSMQFLLTSVGWNIDKIPAIWYKRTGGSNFRKFTAFTPNYEPFFHVWKGEARKLSKVSNAVFCHDNPSKKIHPTEKPLGLLKELIKLTTIKGELVIDPFGGSASTMDACIETERKGVSYELEERWYNVGVERLNNRK